MKTFDVRITPRRGAAESGPPSESTPPPEIRFRVAADSWVDAWNQALAALGDASIPEDTTCTVGPARVELECASDGRRFLIEPLARTDPRVIAGQPMLVAEGGELVPIHLASAAPRERSARFSTARGAPLSPLAVPRRKLGEPSARRSEPTPPTTPELARDRGLSVGPSKRAADDGVDWRGDAADPLARVLSGLERERLLARPMRINPRTGLPTPLESAAQPSPHGTRVDQRAPGPASDRRVRIDLPDLSRRGSRETTAPAVPRLRSGGESLSLGAGGVDRFEPTSSYPPGSPLSATDTDLEAASLPQQYRPVLSELAPPSGAALLEWAADTAWQQIPCALSLCLSGADALVVVAARGLRAREALGGRVARTGAPGQLWRASHRIRYAEGSPVAFEHPDGGRLELRVDSALCVPVTDGAEPILLLLLNAPRPGGFTDAEARALAYLARTVAEHR